MQNELLQEPELRSLAVRTRGAGRHVERHHRQFSEARFDVAALGVELAALEAALHFARRLAAVQRDAAIALLLRKGVAGLVKPEAVQLRVEIVLLAFHLLQADHSGPLRAKPPEKTLFCCRADAVDVESDDFQEEGKVDAPPCAADHCAGACRNFSTSVICPGFS